MLFLPQFVVVVAFPAMASAGDGGRAPAREPGRRSLALGGGRHARRAGCCRELALVFVGGDGVRRDRADQLWLFALLGTVLSALQLLVYAVLARQGRRSSLLLWVGLVAMVVVGVHRRLADRRWWSACWSSTRVLLVAAARAERLRWSAGGRSPPADLSRQWAASCQLRPVPTETSSGTVSSAAPAICSRTSASSCVPLPRRHLEHELVVDLEQHPRRAGRPRASARSTWSIATLIRSAAEPWIGALSAIRSAISRRCRLSLVRSGR